MPIKLEERVTFSQRFMSNEDNLSTLSLQILEIMKAIQLGAVLPRTQAEIATMLGVTQPTVSKHILTLEAFGYVERLPIKQRQYRLAETAPATCDSRAAKHWAKDSVPSTTN